MSKIQFPNGTKFAFTIFDDTDKSTVENVRPIYELLNNLGLKTTKSVWVYSSKSPYNFKNDDRPTQTLEDSTYLNFIRWLSNQGFEIALHGVGLDSSERERIISGIELFHKLLGFYPTSHTNHYNENYKAENYEAIYFGKERLNCPLFKFLVGNFKKVKSFGHIESSPYFWGDVCQKYIRYVRNFTFREINLLKINPTLPYFDPKKPFVPFWFSSSDGADVKKFNKLLSLSNQERLEREGGVSIVYTHFASGFVKNGKVNPETKKLLEELAKRNGYFVPVTPLLDYLRSQREDLAIPESELRKMECQWFCEKIPEKFLKTKLF